MPKLMFASTSNDGGPYLVSGTCSTVSIGGRLVPETGSLEKKFATVNMTSKRRCKDHKPQKITGSKSCPGFEKHASGTFKSIRRLDQRTRVACCRSIDRSAPIGPERDMASMGFAPFAFSSLIQGGAHRKPPPNRNTKGGARALFLTSSFPPDHSAGCTGN